MFCFKHFHYTRSSVPRLPKTIFPFSNIAIIWYNAKIVSYEISQTIRATVSRIGIRLHGNTLPVCREIYTRYLWYRIAFQTRTRKSAPSTSPLPEVHSLLAVFDDRPQLFITTLHFVQRNTSVWVNWSRWDYHFSIFVRFCVV